MPCLECQHLRMKGTPKHQALTASCQFLSHLPSWCLAALGWVVIPVSELPDQKHRIWANMTSILQMIPRSTRLRFSHRIDMACGVKIPSMCRLTLGWLKLKLSMVTLTGLRFLHDCEVHIATDQMDPKCLKEQQASPEVYPMASDHNCSITSCMVALRLSNLITLLSNKTAGK